MEIFETRETHYRSAKYFTKLDIFYCIFAFIKIVDIWPFKGLEQFNEWHKSLKMIFHHCLVDASEPLKKCQFKNIHKKENRKNVRPKIQPRVYQEYRRLLKFQSAL